jgi:hypothetical protein
VSDRRLGAGCDRFCDRSLFRRSGRPREHHAHLLQSRAIRMQMPFHCGETICLHALSLAGLDKLCSDLSASVQHALDDPGHAAHGLLKL